MALVAPFVLLLAGVLAISCSTAKKKTASEDGGGENPLAAALTIARPIPEETIASLKAIADSPASQLPDDPATSDDAEGLAIAGDPAKAGNSETAALTEDATVGFIAPASWRAPGLNPDEVNPGDLFWDNEGPVLRKVFSLLDELPASERNPVLNQFTESKTARLPVTLSRRELAGLTSVAPEDAPLPTRSVALDFRTETHQINPERHLALLAQIAKGESAGAIGSAERLSRLKEQLDAAKQRLNSGETLYLVTIVSESSVIHATYPGAPVGKRDAEPIRNAIAALYPHLRNLEAAKGAESIEITGRPRIVWEFETREVTVKDGKFVIGPKVEVGR